MNCSRLNSAKTFEKRLQNHIRVVLWKQTIKKYIYSKNDNILKSGKIDYSVAKPQKQKCQIWFVLGCTSKLKNHSENDLKTTLLFYALCSNDIKFTAIA